MWTRKDNWFILFTNEDIWSKFPELVCRKGVMKYLNIDEKMLKEHTYDQKQLLTVKFDSEEELNNELDANGVEVVIWKKKYIKINSRFIFNLNLHDVKSISNFIIVYDQYNNHVELVDSSVV